MATTALDETLQRDRTAELSALPTPLTRGGKSEASRRSDIFERSPAAAGAARAADPYAKEVWENTCLEGNHDNVVLLKKLGFK